MTMSRRRRSATAARSPAIQIRKRPDAIRCIRDAAPATATVHGSPVSAATCRRLLPGGERAPGCRSEICSCCRAAAIAQPRQPLCLDERGAGDELREPCSLGMPEERQVPPIERQQFVARRLEARGRAPHATAARSTRPRPTALGHSASPRRAVDVVPVHLDRHLPRLRRTRPAQLPASRVEVLLKRAPCTFSSLAAASAPRGDRIRPTAQIDPPERRQTDASSCQRARVQRSQRCVHVSSTTQPLRLVRGGTGRSRPASVDRVEQQPRCGVREGVAPQ